MVSTVKVGGVDTLGVTRAGDATVEYMSDRTGKLVRVEVFVGEAHYPKAGRSVRWHNLFNVVRYVDGCKTYRQYDDPEVALDQFHKLPTEDKTLEQFCIDGKTRLGRFVAVQEMSGGRLKGFAVVGKEAKE